MARLLTLGVLRRYCSCNNHVRSPLTPLQKGGTGDLLKVPLFKGDLGGSKLRTVVIKANSPIINCMNRKPLKRYKVNSLGRASPWAFLGRAWERVNYQFYLITSPEKTDSIEIGNQRHNPAKKR